MTKTITFIVSVLLSLLASAPGWAREWVVDRVSGTAWAISSTSGPVEIKTQMTIAEGLTIATSSNGRVRLISENNVMTLLPNSVAAVVPKSFFSSKTEVLQKSGKIEFDIEKRKQPHFTVQTPYMAAVVKGTKFTVSVARTTTNIGVNRGLVQVSDLRTGESAAVGAGQKASVASAKGGLRTGGVNAPTVSAGRPASPAVSPVGMDLSDFRAQSDVSRTSASGTSADDNASTASNASRGGGSGQTSGNGSGGDGDGNGDNGNGNGGGDGNGNNGNGNGGGNAGGDGNGNNGNGNGGGNAGGNGNGNNGNGNGNGGSNAGGNGKGNNGNGNGNGGGNK